MSSRKVVVELKIKAVIVIDEGTEVSEVVNEMDYNFTDGTGNAVIEDTTLIDFEVADSR